MKFEITKSEFDNIFSLVGIKKYIELVSVEGENVCFSVNDISAFQDQMFYNIVEDGMDQEGEVNKTGKELYRIYDKILYQIDNKQ